MIKSDADLPGLKQRTWALNLPLLVPLPWTHVQILLKSSISIILVFVKWETNENFPIFLFFKIGVFPSMTQEAEWKTETLVWFLSLGFNPVNQCCLSDGFAPDNMKKQVTVWFHTLHKRKARVYCDQRQARASLEDVRRIYTDYKTLRVYFKSISRIC